MMSSMPDSWSRLRNFANCKKINQPFICVWHNQSITWLFRTRVDAILQQTWEWFFCVSWDSSVGTVTRAVRVWFPVGARNFFSSPPCPDWLWGPPSLLSSEYWGVLSPELKWQGREANHSPPSSAKVKDYVELNLHSPYAFMAWCLAKHGDNFAVPENDF
jgi:hypothetical protein